MIICGLKIGFFEYLSKKYETRIQTEISNIEVKTTL